MRARPVLELYLRRKALGLSQEELARRSGLPRYVVANIERARLNATPEELRQLGLVLGVAEPQLLVRPVRLPAPVADVSADNEVLA